MFGCHLMFIESYCVLNAFLFFHSRVKFLICLEIIFFYKRKFVTGFIFFCTFTLFIENLLKTVLSMLICTMISLRYCTFIYVQVYYFVFQIFHLRANTIDLNNSNFIVGRHLSNTTEAEQTHTPNLVCMCYSLYHTQSKGIMKRFSTYK